MAGKGPADTRTPNHKKRRENHDQIDWTVAKAHKTCKHFDCGWCYHEEANKPEECVGTLLCGKKEKCKHKYMPYLDYNDTRIRHSEPMRCVKCGKNSE